MQLFSVGRTCHRFHTSRMHGKNKTGNPGRPSSYTQTTEKPKQGQDDAQMQQQVVGMVPPSCQTKHRIVCEITGGNDGAVCQLPTGREINRSKKVFQMAQVPNECVVGYDKTVVVDKAIRQAMSVAKKNCEDKG